MATGGRCASASHLNNTCQVCEIGLLLKGRPAGHLDETAAISRLCLGVATWRTAGSAAALYADRPDVSRQILDALRQVRTPTSARKRAKEPVMKAHTSQTSCTAGKGYPT